MEEKYGFTKMSPGEFEEWISVLKVARTIIKVQHHHTYIPGYRHFNGNNHFERQKAMRDFHVISNGWSNIAQHFTIFPDGAIVTGRSLEAIPAGIKGQNSGAICIENFGNFDIGGDVMNPGHKDAIVAVTAALCRKFSLPVNTTSIIYHHWFDLKTGARNNGTKNNKSCPGTNFFGGNKPENCEKYFLPLVKARLGALPPATEPALVESFVIVNVDSLNIRTGPSVSFLKAPDREPAVLGAVLRVYEEQNEWLKISGKLSHWVSGKYTLPTRRATVNAIALNIRSGAGIAYPKTGSLAKGDEVFITEEKDGWGKLGLEEKWVSKKYLDFK